MMPRSVDFRFALRELTVSGRVGDDGEKGGRI
jgi:hypothetical protein